MYINDEKLKFIIESYPGDFVIIQGVKATELRIIHVSDSVPAINGMTLKEFKDMKYARDVLVEEDVERCSKLLTEGIFDAKEPEDVYIATRVYHKKLGFVRISGVCRYIGENEEGKCIICVLKPLPFDGKHGFIKDDTLLGSDVRDDGYETLRYLVNNVSFGMGIFQLHKKNIVRFAANSRLKEITGIEKVISVDELQKELIRGIHPDDKQAFINQMQGILLKKKVADSFRYKSPVQRRWRWINLGAKSIVDGDDVVVFFTLEDVTREKHRDLEVEKTTRIYKAAVANSKMLIWEYDIKKKRMLVADDYYFNRLTERNNASSVFNNMPEGLYPLVADESRELLKEIYARIDAGEPSVSGDVWVRSETKEKASCMHMEISNVFDGRGKPVRAYGVGIDVTKRKEHEEYYANLYNSIIEDNTDIVASIKVNFRQDICYRDTNKGFEIYTFDTDITINEFVEAFCDRLVYQETRQEVFDQLSRKALLDRYQDGETACGVEVHFRRDSGEKTWVKMMVNMIENPYNGELEGIFYCTDVTEKKMKEAIVQYMIEQRYDYGATIDIESENLEIWTRNADFNVAPDTNFLNYSKWRENPMEFIVDPSDVEYFKEGTDLKKVIESLEDNNHYTLTILGIGKGIKRYIQIEYGWLDESKKRMVMLCSDVSEEKRLEQERVKTLKDTLEAADMANKSKGEFLSRISHDIRTPISIITSMTEFAMEDIDKKGRLKADLIRIRSANQFLLSLINDVLDISKIDSGKIKLNEDVYPYSAHETNVQNVLKTLCSQKSLQYEYYRNRITGTIVCDSVRINQIVLNIISNAVKYTNPGGRITYTSDSTDLPNGNVRWGMIVKDTGIGMSEEFQKTLFDPFSQEYDNPLRQKAQAGTGLGMSIVKRMIDIMGGSISVESKVGEGTQISVYIEFPCAERNPKYRPLLEEKLKDKVQTTDLKGKVLLAEDNPVNTVIAVRLLTSYGLEVDTAVDGGEVVSKFIASKPGEYVGVLMDIQMPVMNGYEAASEIRKCAHDDAFIIPIIAMTADAFNEAKEKCMKVGMNYFVTKPLNKDSLKETLRENLLRQDAMKEA